MNSSIITKLFARWNNHFVVVSALLIVKFAFVRYIMFNSTNILRDVFVEVGGILLLSSIIELVFKNSRWIGLVYFIYNAVLSIFLFSLLLYFNAFARIYTYHAVTEVRMVGSLSDGGGLSMVFKEWYLLLYLDLVLMAGFALIRRYRIRNIRLARSRMSMVALVGVGLSIGNMILGLGHANDVMAFADEAGILNAEMFQVYESNVQSSVQISDVTQANIDNLKGITQPEHPKYFGSAKGKNLIVIQMESIPNFVIGAKVSGVQVTPTLDGLTKSDIYLKNWTTEIGQGHTSDAEIITNTSLYPLEEGCLFQAFPYTDFPSLPKLLNQAGYQTMTMHTNDIKFYNRDIVYPSLGFQKMYDQQYYGDRDKISYAASDDVLFRKSLPLLESQQSKGKPFYSFMVTLSSHEPFLLPAKYQDLPLPYDMQGTDVGNFLTAAHYADAALGRFITSLKKDGIWDNSVVLMYGDHFPFPDTWYEDNPTEKAAFVEAVGHEPDVVDMYNIAGILHVPGMKPQTLTMPGGEIDTLPTVCNLLGIKVNQIHFGGDVLNETNNVVGFRFYEPDGTFEDNEVLYNPTSQRGIQLDTRNTVGSTSKSEKESENITELEQMSTVYLEHLPTR